MNRLIHINVNNVVIYYRTVVNIYKINNYLNALVVLKDITLIITHTVSHVIKIVLIAMVILNIIVLNARIILNSSNKKMVIKCVKNLYNVTTHINVNLKNN